MRQAIDFENVIYGMYNYSAAIRARAAKDTVC